MALKGNLKDLSLTQLLNLIRLARKTGVLTIQDGGAPLRIFCEDGRLTYVAREGQVLPLGQLLVAAGRVTLDQLGVVKPHLVLRTDKELALRLMDLGFVTQDDIIETLRQQMLAILLPVFSWTKGSFNFDAGDGPPQDEIVLSVDVEAIVVEGGRRLRETGRAQETVPTLDVVARLTPRQESKTADVNLSIEQWKVLSSVNGRATLRQIGAAAGLNESRTRQAFQDLVNAGLVELAAPREDGLEASEPAKAATGDPAPAPSRPALQRLMDRIRRV
jgi:hypothetical protein